MHKRGQEFHLLADNVPAYFSYVDTELRYRFVNKRYEELFGRPQAELGGQFVKDVVGEANFSTIESHLREALAGREVSFLYPMVLPNGDDRWINVHCLPDRDETGRIRGVLALMTDITAQKRSELAMQQNQLALEEKRHELQVLTDKLFMVQDSERQRIARDLHDDFSQRLTALVLEVASLQQHPPRLPELIGKALEPVCEELTQLTSDLHDLAYQLHPPLLRHAGLQAAIEDHIHKAIERTGLRITLKTKDLPRSIPFDWSICLFRVLQESLQNVAKHAKATEVLVKLSGSSKGIGLSVIDNGKGFDEHDKSGHQKGLGLISMQERLRLLNGFLNIHSRPADGTKVCAWIPFQEQTP
ncbi:MAG: PAS domain-containing protein [Nitrospira sp.]|nr:PAS domain-containing protein [Nitrospira sp.]